MRDLHAAVDAGNHQSFFAPVKLKRLAELEGQRHERPGRRSLAFPLAPCANEVGQPAVAALIALLLDLGMQRPCRAPFMLCPPGISAQHQHQRVMERTQLAGRRFAPVARLDFGRRLDPFLHSVARQGRAPRDVAEREMVAEAHPLDLANHVHGDHLFALLKYSAKQLSTLVNFGSAGSGLDGQFSVGANTNASLKPEGRLLGIGS